jgi:hypothetical protein
MNPKGILNAFHQVNLSDGCGRKRVSLECQPGSQSLFHQVNLSDPVKNTLLCNKNAVAIPFSSGQSFRQSSGSMMKIPKTPSTSQSLFHQVNLSDGYASYMAGKKDR